MDSSSPSNDQLLSLIARALPGWTLAPPKEHTARSTNPNIRPGPSLVQLAKKAWMNNEPNAESFRVMPTNGGAAKVAELRNGRVQIVQG